MSPRMTDRDEGTKEEYHPAFPSITDPIIEEDPQSPTPYPWNGRFFIRNPEVLLPEGSIILT